MTTKNRDHLRESDPWDDHGHGEARIYQNRITPVYSGWATETGESTNNSYTKKIDGSGSGDSAPEVQIQGGQARVDEITEGWRPHMRRDGSASCTPWSMGPNYHHPPSGIKYNK